MNEVVPSNAQQSVLFQNWWSFVLRGLAAILFGLAAFAIPHVTLRALIVVFAAYALVEGAFGIFGAMRAIHNEKRSLLLLLTGVASVAAGLMALFAPALTKITILYLIAAWALFTGILALVTSVRLRQFIEGEWLLGLSGLLSILFAILIVASPRVGALVMIYQIGFYALAFGTILLAVGFRLKQQGHAPRHAGKSPF